MSQYAPILVGLVIAFGGVILAPAVLAADGGTVPAGGTPTPNGQPAQGGPPALAVPVSCRVLFQPLNVDSRQELEDQLSRSESPLVRQRLAALTDGHVFRVSIVGGQLLLQSHRWSGQGAPKGFFAYEFLLPWQQALVHSLAAHWEDGGGGRARSAESTGQRLTPVDPLDPREFLQTLRARLQLSPSQLGARLGVGPDRISGWETDRSRPDWKSFIRLLRMAAPVRILPAEWEDFLAFLRDHGDDWAKATRSLRLEGRLDGVPFSVATRWENGDATPGFEELGLLMEIYRTR